MHATRRRRHLGITALSLLGSIVLIKCGMELWTRNVGVCETIKPGITEAEIIALLGLSYRDVSDRDGVWLIFPTATIMAGPMRAKVDPETRLVLILRCHEDGPATWDIEAAARSGTDK